MKLLYTLLVLVTFYLGKFEAFAVQDSCYYSMQGKVFDAETKEPIPYVSVKVKGSDKMTLTDINGEFTIKGLCNKQNTLIISCFGYCDSVCEQNHQHGKTPHIYLVKNVLELSEVVISAEKSEEEGILSVAQEKINKEELQSNPMQSLASALSDIEGVTLTSTGTNVQLPVIHGLYGNRILILNNGLKHGFQNWGADHAPEIDISSAHSLTVVKGAAGVKFGPEALGGAIIIEPHPLYFHEPIFTNVSSGYHTNGRGLFTSLEVGHGLKKWSYYVGTHYTKAGDRHTPDYSLTNSGKEEKSINGGVRYKHENWGIKVQYNFVNQSLALLRSSVAESGNAFVKAINSPEPIIIRPFSYGIEEPNQLTHHHLGKAEINWWYSEKAKLTFRVGRQLNKRREYDVRRNADKPIINLDLITGDYQLEWKHPDWSKLDGLIGLQVFKQDNNNNPGTSTTPFIPNYNTLRYSSFVIENFKIEKNTFEAGIRVDYEFNNVRGRETSQGMFSDNFSFSNLTSSLGYIVEISESSTFRTNIGTAWRTPNMAELFSFGQHGFKTSFGLLRYNMNEEGKLSTNTVVKKNNSDVSPEKGYKWINKLRMEKQTSAYTFIAYSHYIQNFVFDRPVAVIGTIRGPMPVFIFDQADALFVGVDFSWRKNWSQRIVGSYSMSYLWSKNIRKNEPLIGQPPISINYKMTWEMGKLWKITSSHLTMKPSYTFRQFQAPRTVRPDELINGTANINSNSEVFNFKDAPKGYFRLDMSWTIKTGSLTASIAVQNVFNTRYRDYLNEMRYFADEPARNILITINYRYRKMNRTK